MLGFGAPNVQEIRSDRVRYMYILVLEGYMYTKGIALVPVKIVQLGLKFKSNVLKSKWPNLRLSQKYY